METMKLTRTDSTEIEAVGMCLEKDLLYVIPENGSPIPIGWFTCDENFCTFLLEHGEITKIDSDDIRDG